MLEAVNNLIIYPIQTPYKIFSALLDQEQAESYKTDTQPIETGHRHIAHLNRKYMVCLCQLSEGIEFGKALIKNEFNCVNCVKAQQYK